jgi:hypothetical protein
MITLDTIQWDETKGFDEQDMLAQVWFQKNVGEKMGFSKEEGKEVPTFDKNGRPENWKIQAGNFEFEVRWNYQRKESSDWSKGRDTITVKKLK